MQPMKASYGQLYLLQLSLEQQQVSGVVPAVARFGALMETALDPWIRDLLQECRVQFVHAATSERSNVCRRLQDALRKSLARYRGNKLYY